MDNLPRSGEALRDDNYFLLNPSKVDADHIYVFVLLVAPGKPVRYFIVPGQTLVDEPARFGKGFLDQKLSGNLPRTLAAQGFEDAWDTFGSAVD